MKKIISALTLSILLVNLSSMPLLASNSSDSTISTYTIGSYCESDNK